VCFSVVPAGTLFHDVVPYPTVNCGANVLCPSGTLRVEIQGAFWQKNPEGMAENSPPIYRWGNFKGVLEFGYYLLFVISPFRPEVE